EAPEVTCPEGQILACTAILPNAATTIAEFLALDGASLDDDCTLVADLEISSSDDLGVGVPACKNGYSVTRTYIITDACDEATTCEQVFTFEADEDAPTVSNPTTVNLTCSDDLPDAATTIAEFLALDGASTTDNCTNDNDLGITHEDSTNPQPDCIEGYTITRTYTITDLCGEAATVTQL
ncbi:MAG: hypothetical protein ACPGXL_10775, partial [Chitinophagales bacterium]